MAKGKDQIVLPDGASWNNSHPSVVAGKSAARIEVDTSKVYPRILKELTDGTRLEAKAERLAAQAGPGVKVSKSGIPSNMPQEQQDQLRCIRQFHENGMDQYWCEVVYQCAKMEVQAAFEGTELDPRLSEMPVEIHLRRCDEFALKAHPEGRGAQLATQGKEARAHFARIRGRVPFS